MQDTRRMRIRQVQHRKRQQAKLVVGLVLAAVVIGCVLLMWSVLHPNAPQDAQAQGMQNSETQNVESQGIETQNEPVANNEAQIPILPEEESWKTILVNNDHLLADGYVPELESVDDRGFLFDARAAADMRAMLQDARTEGLSPMICSSYRSWERQTALFEKQVEKQQATGLTYEEAYQKAQTVVAYPGTSEHQSGLAADIVATSHQLLDDSQAETAEQQWLMANCWKYGFVLRYPQGKEDVTKIIYEPWHYRYVGKEVAQYLTEHSLCLEEYWMQLEAQQQS